MQELLSPWSWGVSSSRRTAVFTHLVKSYLNPVLLGFLWMHHDISMIDHELSLPRGWGGADSSKSLTMACFFPVTSPLQEPTQNHITETKTLLSPRRFQGILELCVRNQAQGPNIKTKDAPSALITQEITRVSGALCQELGQGPKYIYFYYFIAMLSWFTVSHWLR